MANKGIKGITIEIGGDTKGLDKALQGVNNQSKDLQAELKAVERGLKFDPGNVELVRQKQELLTASIASTSDKLDVLRTAQSQVQAQFERNEIGVEQYRAFQRELQQTEGEMSRLQSQLGSLGVEQDRLSQTTRQLGTFFEATGTDVEQFSGTLGTRLTQAIRDGSASADQMERALRLMGRQALGAGVDIDQMREALRNADNGANLDGIRQDLSRITEEANTAEDALNGFGQELTSVIGGLAAGGGIAGVVTAALDTASLDTKIDIAFNVPEESKQSILEAIKSVDKYGVEGEEALEGVRRQWALNKLESDQANASIIEGAGVITKTYAGIDFIELIQETNEFAAALQISNEEALALTDALLKTGFPPEQLDTMAEYGMQMKGIGFSTAEIQSIFEKGIETKSWNIDNLNDGVKEARITMSEFGLEIPKALKPLITDTGLSLTQFGNWGKAVAGGGEEGAKAMAEVSDWLQTIEDDALRNEMAIKVFGTKAEDQGDNMIAVFQGLADAQDKTRQNLDQYNSSVERMNADPMVQMKDAINNMMTALKPILLEIAGIVAALAQWAAENPTLIASIVAIGATLGILVGAFAVLMPAIGALVGLWPALVLAIGGIGTPILIAIGAIALLATAFVALWQNSETFRNNLSSVFESIKNVAVTVFKTVASFIGEKIAQIKQFWDTDGAQILQAVENVFNGIMAVVQFVMPAIKFVIDVVWTAIKQVISGALDVIMGAVKIFSGLFTGDFSKMWEGVKQLFIGAINVIIGWFTLTFVGGIRTLLMNLSKSGISLVKGMWDDIVKLFTDLGTKASGAVSGMVTRVVTFFKNLLTNAQSIFGTMRTFGASAFEALKTVAINAASKLLLGVKTSFTNMLSAIKTTMGNVKTSVSELWDKVIGVFKPNALLQVGKDVVNGLIKGIGDMFGGVKKQVEALAALIPEWAKDILGIASPSRVMALIGKWVGIGLAEGIDSTSNRVAKSMQDIGYAIIDIMDHYKSETIKIEKATSAEITKINKRTNEDIEKIQNAAYVKKRKTNESENIKIQRLREDSAKKIADIEKKSAADSFKILETSNKEMLEGVKLFIQDKKSLEQLSLVDEALIWQESAKLFSDGTKEKIEAQKLYKTAVDTINKEMVAINTNYQGQIQKINDDLKKGEEDLTKTYQDAYSGRVDAIRNFVGQFEAFVVTNDKSGQDLLNNAQSQVDGLKAWRETLDSLWGKIDDQALMEELEALGPKALGELQALNTLSADELTRYTELYNEKFMLAREQASEELAGMKEDIELRIIEMRLAANTQLGVLEREWLLSIQSITRTTDTELSSLHQVGVNAGQGLLNGLSSMEAPLITKATQIANAISAAIQSALQIHSPSRVMQGFGVNIGQGLIVGMDDMFAKVSSSSKRLSEAVSNVYGSLSNSANKSMGNNSNSTPSSSTVDNSRSFAPSVTIYTNDSGEKAMNRTLRRLAYQFN